MLQRVIRRSGAAVLALLTMWTVITTVGSRSPAEALAAFRGDGLPGKVVRWELGDLTLGRSLPLTTLVVLFETPVLSPLLRAAAEPEPSPAPLPGPENVQPEPAAPAEPAAPEDPPQPAATAEDPPAPVNVREDPTAGLSFEENGVRAETVHPSRSNYEAAGGVTIRNRSSQGLEDVDLDSGAFAVACPREGPQILIVHTHGSEAYTMPEGQGYVSTGSYRTAENDKNVIRIGDEIAAVLSAYGLSVLHDRTRHDDPAYNGAYTRSAASVRAYREKYPGITYILDVHRDAVQDAEGRQYKLVSAEDPRAAQVCFIMGVNHEGWEENLKLAAAVQRTLAADHPTLMRPISLINANYNQDLAPGSVLVEVGAAGNSLDEAVYAARLFADGFARTVLASQTG